MFRLDGKLMSYSSALRVLLKGQRRTPENVLQAARYLHWKCKI